MVQKTQNGLNWRALQARDLGRLQGFSEETITTLEGSMPQKDLCQAFGNSFPLPVMTAIVKNLVKLV